jgi:Fe(3+) dicitrate transport protein
MTALKKFLLASVMVIAPGGVMAQETAPPAPASGTAAPSSAAPAGAATTGQQPATKEGLPEVEVIQQQPKPQQPAQPVQEAAPKPKPKPAPVYVEEPAPKPKKVVKKAAPPPPAPEPAIEPEPAPDAPVEEAAPADPNPIYGAARSTGAAQRAQNGPVSPVNPTSILPGDLQGFSSAGTRIDSYQIDEFHPRTTNDVFNRVPGVHVVNDDGNARHGGIGIRGSPPRRGRKILAMEDGAPINMSLWIDPSIHYTPPMDRVESVEVLRGAVVSYGPNNNHGVVNFRNLSPFGKNEVEIGAEVGSTNSSGGPFTDEDGETFGSIAEEGWNNTQHFHFRQGFGNVGTVFSFSRAEVDGAWDNERLRYNDFYGAIGWKGVDQDLKFSAVYFRQRDNYDEANFTGDEDGAPGNAEDTFFKYIQHCKTCYNPGSRFNTYNADVVRLQLQHDWFLNDDTTLTSRIYAQHHRRDRYQNFQGEDPSAAEDPGLLPVIDGDDIFLPEGNMLGRLRTYRHLGVESRVEFANQPLFGGGTRQDIQMGARYEWHDFTNKNFFGASGQVLEDGDEDGVTVFNRDTYAGAFSAYLQSTLHLTTNFNVTPGVRLDHYKVTRKTFDLTEEEGEAEEGDPVDCNAALGVADCFEIEGYRPDDYTESFNRTHVSPSISFAYEGLYRSTVYGGYHRGLTMHVLREEDFPAGKEVGDNFQLGIRSTAIKGVTFDLAGFHSRIEDFQIKGATSNADGNNIFANADVVEIDGFEVYGRLDIKPFIGGPLNPFFEANYTRSHAVIEKAEDPETGESFAGNLVPEVPPHFLYLTAGLEHADGWDMSVSGSYRGDFFTDVENTPYGGDAEGEDGEVPSVWLLDARASVKLGDTGARLFVHGTNLLDELYISDREDGIKPGQGRTVMGGFKWKFE